MTGQKDNPDDLIAELTKLMAADSRTAAGEARPSAAPAPEVRILGQQGIRIPGVAAPVSSSPAAASPGPGKFDFAPSPKSAAPAPEPRADWQERLGIKSKPEPDPLASFDLPPAAHSSSTSTWRPAIAPGEADPRPTPAASSFNFDFGFNRERPAPQQRPAAPAARPEPAAAVAPIPVRPAAQPSAPAPDPIAELIAAELGTQMQTASQPASFVTQPVPAAPPQAVPPPPPPAMDFTPPAPAVAPQPAPAPEPAPVRQANPAPRPVAENDRFSTAPVFGLGNKITGEVPAPRVELDPMDEIENLIGEAVRVELNMPQPQPRAYESQPSARAPQPQPTPTVPPLGTQFAPRRTTSLREPEFGNSADEAILAAAAAGGSEVGRIDSPFGDERPARQGRQKQKQQPKPSRRERVDADDRPSGGAFRQLIVPAIAGTILLAGGFGLYWALGMSHNGGKAPVLTADATPAKTIPPKPADAAPHSVVMDELGGTAPAATTETLVSRDQTAGDSATQVAASAAPPATDAAGDTGLANRKVRTVTVRPDGSIVSSDDSVAGSSQLPVSRPNVPTVPGAAAANVDATAPAGFATTTTPNAAAGQPGGTTVVANADGTAAGTAPAADASVGTPDPNAPVPLPPPDRAGQTTQVADAPADTTTTASAATPTSRPTSPVNAVIKTNNPTGAKPVDLIGDLASGSDQTAPAAEPATTRPAAPAQQVAAAEPGGAAGGHVQLSSQTSQAGAEASANALLRKFGSLWGGSKPQVVKADLGAKGIYYRVMVLTATAADAATLCSSIKSSGGDCLANR